MITHRAKFPLEDLYRLLLDFRDYAVIIVAPDGRILNWNVGAEYIYGYTSYEMVDENISLLFSVPVKHLTKTSNNTQNGIQHGRKEYECWQSRKDGFMFLTEVIEAPLFDTEGRLSRYAFIVKDLTGQMAIQEESRIFKEKLEDQVRIRTRELEVAIKELEAFSYSVSHDLRAPLRSIHGFSKILQEEYGDMLNSEGKRFLNTIIRSASHMGNLIDDLLKFSQLSKLEIIDSAVDMNGLVHHVIDTLTSIRGDVKYSFVINELHTCMGDENMLRQVWFNLMDNAMKYSKYAKPATIEIGSSRSAGIVQYYISDNGVGFNMKYADKLFGVFQRLHNKAESEGTGLGLALVQRIIQKHNGDVWAESKEGEGAKFYFTIPDKNQ